MKLNPQLGIWFGGACAAFADGFIDGAPVGTPAGLGIAVLDGQTHADLNWQHVVIEIAHALAVPIGTGLSDVRQYKKENPVPSFFVASDSKPPASTAIVQTTS